MHELSIAGEMLDIIQETLGEPKILISVEMVLGALSGVSADALQFCFTELAEQRGFGRPNLDIVERSAVLRCHQCGKTETANTLDATCPACGSRNRQIVGGYECHLEHVTLQE